MKVIPPVLNTLLAVYRMGTCSVLYFMSGNELAVYQKLSPRTLQVVEHMSNHRESTFLKSDVMEAFEL